MTHSCPGCRYDEERKQERLERRRRLRQQNHKGKEKQKGNAAPATDKKPDEDFEDEWATDDGDNNGDENYKDMVDAFMSRAFLYSKTMKEVIAMDKDQGKRVAKTLAKVGSTSKFISEQSKEKMKKGEEKKKKTKQVTNNKEKAGAGGRPSRTEVSVYYWHRSTIYVVESDNLIAAVIAGISFGM
jgi:hypothetical protein